MSEENTEDLETLGRKYLDAKKKRIEAKAAFEAAAAAHETKRTALNDATATEQAAEKAYSAAVAK